MMRSLRSERGFSLLEMMISISISAMLFYTMYAVMRAGDQQVNTAQVQMELQDSAREGLYRMLQEIRQTAPDRITINGAGTGIQFDVPASGNAFDASFNINWNGANTVQYSLGGLNGTQLLRTVVGSGQSTVLANNVTAINFTGNAADPTLVTITVSAQRTLLNGRQLPANPLQMSAQAEIRNT